MRRWMSGLLSAMLAVSLPLSGMAQDERRFDGEIVCTAPISVRAPFGGQVEDFECYTGMRFGAGDEILSLSTTKIYAPADGIVTGVRVQEGDSVQSVEERYGALCYLESEGQFTVSATTSGAYNDEENKIIFAGEKVFLKNPNATTRKGEGIVTGVSGSAYTIEVTDAGTLHLNDEVNVFREEDYAAQSRIGRGRVARASSMAILATGSVLRVHVQQGQRVVRGDVLFETVEGTLDELKAVSSVVSAPQSGSLAQMNVNAGTRVQKDDVLCLIHPDEALRAKISVDEEDVALFSRGTPVRVTFEALDDEWAMGTVISVSGMPEAGNKKFDVYIEFALPEGAREGMSVRVERE